MASSFSSTPCFATLQFSCHDSGWESAPGNYFTLRGSRAWLGSAGIFAYNIPLFMGGEEYDEDPVVGLPDLQKNLFGGGGPGGWLYGTQRQWAQLDSNATKQAMLADVTAMLRITREHSDLLHHDRCSTSILALPYSGGAAPLTIKPYVRYLDGESAVLVLANADAEEDARVVVGVPLASMNLAGLSAYRLTDLWGSNGGGQRVVTEAELGARAVGGPRDTQAGGGLAVLKVEPA